MTGNLNFWDIEVWSFVITLSILFSAMLLANALRRQLPFLRKTLIPSSVLGGFIVLLVNALFKQVFGFSMFQTFTLEALTFHGLGLGFVALAWRNSEKSKDPKARRDVFNTSTVTVGSYLVQAIVGVGITVILSFVIKGTFAAGGVLLPMGYGQGPGQAYNWGTTYQNQYGFAYGSSYGLTVAAMGFVSASVGGVFYLNKLRRKGDPRAQIVNAEEIEALSAEEVTGKNEIPLSESLDKLTVQFGLIFFTYFVSFAAMWGVSKMIDSSGVKFLINTVKPLIWGFNFLVGTAFTVLFKAIMCGFTKKGVVKRVYTNNFMLNRIGGLMFDIMVVASIAAIDLSAFRHKEFWVPILLICVAGALVTYVYNYKICRYLFPDYSDEAFLSMYGMLTGTASTGVILLREIDPMFSTPASHNLIFQNLWSIVLGAPMLLLLGFAARSLTWTVITFGIFFVLFCFILVLQFRDKLFKKKKA